MRLILMRHAKSSWVNSLQPDHDRPLNERGQRSAHLVGHWLKERGYIPDLVLCSTAKRTRETLDCLELQTTLVDFEETLYHASPETLLHALRGTPPVCVMILAHNPGIAALADLILSRAPEHPQFWAFPTCATLVADFEAETWTSVNTATGVPKDFIVPRDLDQTSP